jgi:hypothetical protein
MQSRIMATGAIDKEIAGYLPKLSPAQKKAVLTVVKAFAEEDKVHENVLKEKFAGYETGKIKGISLEELEQKTKKSYKAKRAKK